MSENNEKKIITLVDPSQEQTIDVPPLFPYTVMKKDLVTGITMPQQVPGVNLLEYLAAHAPEIPDWYLEQKATELGIDYFADIDLADWPDPEAAQQVYFTWPWEYAMQMLQYRESFIKQYGR